MSAIEPGWVDLLWFSLLWTICCFAFLLLAGMFPLADRPAAARLAGGWLLVAGNAAALALLLAGAIAYGLAELRLTSLVVAGGLVFLFAPALLEASPTRWRDSRAGLCGLLGVQIGALGIASYMALPRFLRIDF